MPDPSFDSFDAEAAAEGALWIYRVAFDELTEQVRRQCRDRGALLAKVWDHFFSVVEARAGLRYESLVADARIENIQTRAQLAKAKKEADASDAKLAALEEALAGERAANNRERTSSSTAALAAKIKERVTRRGGSTQNVRLGTPREARRRARHRTAAHRRRRRRPRARARSRREVDARGGKSRPFRKTAGGRNGKSRRLAGGGGSRASEPSSPRGTAPSTR